MRVLFVAPTAYPLGGVASWLDYLLPGMRETGVDARLGLVSGARFHDVGRYIAVHTGVPVERIHCATGTTEGRVQAICRSIRDVRPDVVVAVNIPDVFLAVDRWRQRMPDSPRVAMALHSLECDVLEDARRYRDGIDAFIAVNRLIRRKLVRDGGIPESRVHYAPCGAEFFRGQSKQRRPAAITRILHVGRLENVQKRCLDLVAFVEAIEARGTPFRLDIAGDGPDRPAMENALRRYVDAGEVRFHGTVPRRRLITDFYPEADMLLITSQWETGPIVAWEAMSSGLPLISSAYIGSGAENALRHGENACLFEIGDCQQAAALAEHLWISPELRRSLACAGQDLAEARYSEAVSVEAWMRAIGETAREPAARAVGFPAPRQTGRLNRVLSPQQAEPFRRMATALRLRALPVAAGAEWPHSHSSCRSDEAHWRRLEMLDRCDESLGDALLDESR